MANIPQFQKALYLHIPKIDPSIPYPFKYLQKISHIPLSFGQYPCIPKKPSMTSGIHNNLEISPCEPFVCVGCGSKCPL